MHVNTSRQPRHICDEGYCEIPTSSFFTMDEWLSQHVPGWLVQLLHIHLPPLGFKVSHDLFHSSQAFHCFWQLLDTLKSWRENGRQLWFRYTLWNDKQMGDGWERNVIGLQLWRQQLIRWCPEFPPCGFIQSGNSCSCLVCCPLWKPMMSEGRRHNGQRLKSVVMTVSSGLAGNWEADEKEWLHFYTVNHDLHYSLCFFAPAGSFVSVSESSGLHLTDTSSVGLPKTGEAHLLNPPVLWRCICPTCQLSSFTELVWLTGGSQYCDIWRNKRDSWRIGNTSSFSQIA